jgi:CBS domain-containing protein
MREEHVGDLVVVENDGDRVVPVAMLTDRDIVVGVLARDATHLKTLDVGDVVLGTLVTASADEDIGDVLHRMRSFGVRRVPVVDATGTLVGIISLDDVLAGLADELAQAARIVKLQPDRESVRRP